jgi:WD40 repeat protein
VPSSHCHQEDCLTQLGNAGPVQQTHVTFVSSAQFVSGGSDGSVILWNLSSKACIFYHQLPGPVSALLSWRNFIFFSGGTADVYALDWRTFEERGRLRGHSDIVHLMEKVRAKQLLATASLDKSLRLWSVPAFACTKTLTFEVCITSMSISQESDPVSLFALFEDNTIRRISVENGQTLIRWQINHDISAAFIYVLNLSVFVAWRDSEVPCDLHQLAIRAYSCLQVMELAAKTGKKISKFVGLYGVPEAITSSAGVLYCCCNSGTICCWGSRYLGDADPSSDIEDCMTWGGDAVLNADVLSPTSSMRFPITDFVHTQPKPQNEQGPENLQDKLRQYLGAAPKKHTSRPHPIMFSAQQNSPTAAASAVPGIAESGKSQHSIDSVGERRAQIRKVWLGPVRQYLDSSGEQIESSSSSSFLPTDHGDRDRSGSVKHPPMLLRASDFDASRSSVMHGSTPVVAASSLRSTQALDLSSIPTVSFLDISSPSLARTPSIVFDKRAGAGDFFLRAKEYLRTRQVVSAAPSAPQVEMSPLFTQIADNDSIILPHKNDHSVVDAGLNADERFINWSHISKAWGARPKIRNEAKLQPKPK